MNTLHPKLQDLYQHLQWWSPNTYHISDGRIWLLDLAKDRSIGNHCWKKTVASFGCEMGWEIAIINNERPVNHWYFQLGQ